MRDYRITRKTGGQTISIVHALQAPGHDLRNIFLWPRKVVKVEITYEDGTSSLVERLEDQ